MTNKELRDAISHAQGMVNRYGAIKAQIYPQMDEELSKNKSSIEILIQAAERALDGGWKPMSEAKAELILVKSIGGFICSAVPDLFPLDGDWMCTAFLDIRSPIRIHAVGWKEIKTL